MTLRYTIIIQEEEARREYVESLISDVFQVINSTLNGWNRDSEVSVLNKLKPATWFEISPNLRKIFDVVDEVHEMTGGRYDPTSGVIKFAYIDTLADAERPPLPEELRRFKFAVGWRSRIERYKKSANKISKKNANTIIDFDGISKGFAVDHLVNTLCYNGGYENVYVDWGGEVRTAGFHPVRNTPWRTAIVNPPALTRVFRSWKDNIELNKLLGEDDVAFLVELPENTALATSGDYFQIKKFGFHHIVNAQNIAAMKASKNSVASVSILAKSAAFADAIATASMTLETPKKAADFIRDIVGDHPDVVFGYCILGRNGTADAYYTNHFVPQNSLAVTSMNSIDHPTSPTSVVGTNPGTVQSSSSSSGDTDFDITDHSAATRVLVHSPGRISWEGTAMNGEAEFIDVDSLVSVSLNPDPMVTLVVPQKNNPLRAEDQVRFQYASDDGDYESIRFDLTIIDMYALESSAALISARIDQVLPGKNLKTSVMAKMADTIKGQLPISFVPELRNPVEDEAKSIFAQIPYTVCVVTTEGFDGKLYGLTGTSIAVSTAYAKNTLVFNLMHTSTFYAAFTGEEAVIQCYCMMKGTEDITKSFSKNPIVNESKLRGLKKSSLALIQATVRNVHTVQDHAVVVAELTHSKLFSDDITPLLWHRRKYTHLV